MASSNVDSDVATKAEKKARIKQLKAAEDAAKTALDPEKVEEIVKRIGKEDTVKFDNELNTLMGSNVFVKEVMNMSAKAIADAQEELNIKCALEELGLHKEDIDPYGDGEQTQLFGAEAMKMQAQTAKGMDYNLESNSRLSEWAKACYYGRLNQVKNFLSNALTEKEVMQLIEKRESLMRFSGLFHTICGARMKPSKNHAEIAMFLIDNGARVNARDAGGLTPLHYCLSQFGNSYTLEIARALVGNGADVNATNRYGATALFEPCITLNYEFIEFLVCHGCNPKHVDSFGVSCYAYASMNPKIRSIFSKGNRRLAEKDKWLQKSLAASENGKESSSYWIDACAFCGIKEDCLKKCSGCLTVGYCSIDCQKNHWKSHKRSCKAKQSENKKNELVLVVHPVTNAMGEGETLAFNEKSKTVKKLSDGKNTYLGVEKAMRIKVQATVGGQGAREDKPMVVYDKARSYQTWILPTDANFKKLFDLIVDKGYGGIKLYFTAVLKKNSDLQINISETHAETW